MIKVTCQRAIYLPRIDYFYRMSLVDFSVIMDDLEMGRGSVENKGYILSQEGKSKFSVPVINSNRRLVRDVKVVNSTNWRGHHMELLSKAYSEHPYYDEVEAWLFPIYSGKQRYLMDLNLDIIRGVLGQFVAVECSIGD